MKMPNRTSTGGEYTLINRLRCWLVGHDRMPEPAPVRDFLEAYQCRRCNDFCAYRDSRTGTWYKSFDAAWDDVGHQMQLPSVLESFGIVSPGTSTETGT